MSSQIILGAGDLWLRQVTTTPTPIRIATAKKISIQMDKDVIEEHGAYEFSLDAAGGKASLKGKITIAGFETDLVKSIFSSSTSTVGYTAMAVDEAATVPAASGPYTVTVTHSGAIEDFGVIKSSDLSPLTHTTGVPTTGQYAVDEATGIYTFAAADTGLAVKISYGYAVAGSGSTLDIKSGLIGSAPAYLIQGWNTYGGKKIGYRVPTAKITGLSFEFSTEKHVEPEYSFIGTALPGATVMKMFFGQ